ncbi:MAG: heme biosynthesis HemY N-terminal domain-containing protein, partial [Caulobacteraceae bacterium]
MIRAALALVLIAALIVAVTALMGEPGRATIEWLGWRLDMTAAAAVLLIAAGGLVSAVFWKLIGIAIEAPRRAAKARSEHRRQQGLELITRGFVAVEAGEGGEARRCALKAAELVDEAQDLVRVLAAQAAEAQGDQTAAETAYAAMLGAPRLSVAGYRGLMRLAANRGDEEAAQRYAEAAYGMARGAQWAWKSLLDARLAQGDWPGALALLRGAVERKIVTPVVADRTRAALLTACAATAEPGAAKVSDQAVEAARLRSDFTPAAAIAARRLQADGRTEKASSIIEAAWRAAPHPALWLAYRDLVANETPRERAERLGRLAALDPGHRESRMLQVEQMLIAGESDAIREAASALADEPATTRLCSLMVRAAK